jgi:hypothetical protein
VDERLVSVVETEFYIRQAEQLLTEDEQASVSEMLARDPNCGVVLRGGGGIRKVRIALQGRGKSGGARVIYFFKNETMPVFLLAVFSKNTKENLSAAELNALRRFIDALVNEYGRS